MDKNPELKSTSAPSAAATPAESRVELSRGLFLAGCAVLIATYFFQSLYHISDVPLIDPDEPRYAAAGRAMAEGGSWLIPEFNGEQRINKPPLFYWLVGGSCVLGGGSDELTSRAPSILMGLLTLIVTLLAAASMFGRRTALIAGVILVSMPMFGAMSRTCITDMTLTAFMSGTLFILMLIMAEKIQTRSAIWIAGVLFGLAILTKATPALVVVLIVLIDRALALTPEKRPLTRWIPWLLGGAMLLASVALFFPDAILNTAAQLLAAVVLVLVLAAAWRSGIGPLAKFSWLGGLLLALLVGLWWYALLMAVLGWPQFYDLLSVEIAGRVAGQMHREPMFFYLYTLLAVAFPWSIGLIGSLRAAWPNSVSDDSSYARADRFVIAWVLGVLLFFSIPGAKLATYLLPALPAAAILVTRFIERCAERDSALRLRTFTVVFAGILCVTLSVLILNPGWIEGEHDPFVASLPVPLWALSLLIVASFTGGWLLVTRGRGAAGVAVMFAATVGVLLMVLPAMLPNLEKRSNRALCLKVRAQIDDAVREGRIVSAGTAVESLSYYLHSTVHEMRKRRAQESFSAAVEEELARPEKVVIFLQKRYFARMLGTNRKTVLGYSREKLITSLPPGSRFVDMDDDIIVISNR
ncbi:MAG TPA: glycosyltransferase family 39 protein [Planctomycetota bacterium]|nr:glycosyltransferase family 39 protein [Planctomycetota bacterium]